MGFLPFLVPFIEWNRPEAIQEIKTVLFLNREKRWFLPSNTREELFVNQNCIYTFNLRKDYVVSYNW